MHQKGSTVPFGRAIFVIFATNLQTGIFVPKWSHFLQCVFERAKFEKQEVVNMCRFDLA